jgi:nicotinate-nucleotide adenylyltransferase
VFGGSFNPIHLGHLLAAADVCEALALDQVLFVPAALPPHKPAADMAPAHDRFEMTRLAVAAHPRFSVSEIEMSRPGPSYMVDTLRALAERGDDALHLLIGSETFLDLPRWKAPREVASLARLAVVPRAGGGFDPGGAAARAVLDELDLAPFTRDAAGPARVPVLVEAASLPISGSDLRRRVREGRSLAYRMPDPVIGYIRRQGLYQTPVPAAAASEAR